MQNASITGETKRPCQGWGVVTGAGKMARGARLSGNQPII